MPSLFGAQRMVLQAIQDLQKYAADHVTDERIAQERDGNNFPIVLKYGITFLDRSATRRSAAWTPMYRESNG